MLHLPVVLLPGTCETLALELDKEKLLLVNTQALCLSSFLVKQFQASLKLPVSSSILLTTPSEYMSFNSSLLYKFEEG
jgi:hypothetical protein